MVIFGMGDNGEESGGDFTEKGDLSDEVRILSSKSKKCPVNVKFSPVNRSFI
jgi:hypothetical protein